MVLTKLFYSICRIKAFSELFEINFEHLLTILKSPGLNFADQNGDEKWRIL